MLSRVATVAKASSVRARTPRPDRFLGERNYVDLGYGGWDWIVCCGRGYVGKELSKAPTLAGRTDTMRILCCCLLVLAGAGTTTAGEPKPVAIFDGKSLTGWKAATENMYEKPGKLSVKDAAIVMPQGTIATGIVYAKKDFPLTNYEVSLEARRTKGSDFFCGMTFPVGKEYCTLICGGWGGGTVGLSNVDDFSADENETTSYIEFKNGQWYQIRLRVTDAKIEAWIDKEKIVDLQRKDKKFAIWWEQEPLRPFGIGNWGTSSELRKLTLTRLAKEKPQE